MATVNFSVPDSVKEDFNARFQGRNKSAIISDLMERAIEEAERAARRKVMMDALKAGAPCGKANVQLIYLRYIYNILG